MNIIFVSLGMQLLGHKLSVCLALKETTKLFFIASVPFFFHYYQQYTTVPVVLHSYQHLVLSVFFSLVILIGVVLSHHGIHFHFHNSLWCWLSFSCPYMPFVYHLR